MMKLTYPAGKFLILGIICTGLVFGLLISQTNNSTDNVQNNGISQITIFPTLPNREITNLVESTRLPILTYHYVEVVQDKNDTIRQKLDISPSIFENQIIALKEASYSAVFMKDLGNYFEGKEKLPDKPVAITFDDGYRDFYTDVFPILKKHSVKATLYVITGFLDRPNFLTRVQLKEIAGSGLIEIASHTLHHIDLKKADEKTSRQEIIESKKALEDIIGNKVYDFAYPYGSYSENSIKLVKEAGYLTAVTTKSGIIQTPGNKYSLYRLRPGSKTGKSLIGWLENIQDKK